MLLGGSGFSSRPGMSVFTLPRISLASHVMLPARSGSPALQAFCGWYLHPHHHRGRIALENAKLLNVNMQTLMSHRVLRVGQLTHFASTSRFCASTSLNMDILAMLCCPWRICGDVSDQRSEYSTSVGGETLVLCGFVRICVPPHRMRVLRSLW